jgi:hypothetical protein
MPISAFCCRRRTISYSLTEDDRIRGSVARTVRNAELLLPLRPRPLEEELADNDFRAIRTSKPETAWGLDLGYEHQLGKSGIAGINFFYPRCEGPDRNLQHRR